MWLLYPPPIRISIRAVVCGETRTKQLLKCWEFYLASREHSIRARMLARSLLLSSFPHALELKHLKEYNQQSNAVETWQRWAIALKRDNTALKGNGVDEEVTQWEWILKSPNPIRPSRCSDGSLNPATQIAPLFSMVLNPRERKRPATSCDAQAMVAICHRWKANSQQCDQLTQLK